MRITYKLRESMAVIVSGEPCILTFYSDGRLQRYEGRCYKGVAHFPLLPYATVSSDYWITRKKIAA